MSDAIRLRPAAPADAAFLFDVYASTRMEELALTGWDETTRLAFLQQQSQAQARAYRDRFPGSSYQIILWGEVPIGRLLVSRAPDEIRVVDLALLPSHRGQGIGRSLFREILDESERSRKPVRMQVETSNPALRLYLRLGFVVISQSTLHMELEWGAP